jgi:hypothetical protein
MAVSGEEDREAGKRYKHHHGNVEDQRNDGTQPQHDQNIEYIAADHIAYGEITLATDTDLTP